MNKVISLLLIIIFLFLAVIGWWQFGQARLALVQADQKASAVNCNLKVLAFASMFVEKVLNAPGEVDFETRLKLENSMRDIGDQALLTQWRNFVDSKDEKTAQTEVKKLLILLLNRIQPTA